MNVVQACKDRAILDSNHSLFSNPSWLNENGNFDDQVAIENISSYIKQHWNLEKKYLFTVEKSLLKMVDISCHSYKVSLMYYFKPLRHYRYMDDFYLHDMSTIQNKSLIH